MNTLDASTLRLKRESAIERVEAEIERLLTWEERQAFQIGWNCACSAMIEQQVQQASQTLTAMDEMREACAEALEVLEGYYDTQDGPDGQPKPNRAMQAGTRLREVLGGL